MPVARRPASGPGPEHAVTQRQGCGASCPVRAPVLPHLDLHRLRTRSTHRGHPHLDLVLEQRRDVGALPHDHHDLGEGERFGLPPAALRALLVLGEKRCMAPGELGRRLGVTKSRVTAVTTGLSHHNLIEKHPDPNDARVTLLSLTPSGRQAYDEVCVFMKGLFRTMLDRVDPQEREALLGSLDVLRRCMESTRADIAC